MGTALQIIVYPGFHSTTFNDSLIAGKHVHGSPFIAVIT